MRIGSFGAMEIIVILVVLLLIFGARRLPEIGSSLGRSMRMFKSSVTGEDEAQATSAAVEKPKVTANNNDDLV